LQQVILRRLLAAGIRPAKVFLEVMPEMLSARDGSPIEERWKYTDRFTAAEVVYLSRYYAQPYRLFYPWAYTRLLPCTRAQVELHNALGLDVLPGQGRCDRGRDSYGWGSCNETFSPEEVQRLTRSVLEQYASALGQPKLAPGAVQAVRDLVDLCRELHIAVEVVVPPAGTGYRSFAPAVQEGQMDVVRSLARELGVNLIDARTWVDDDGFWDGLHATIKGADQYTQRFAFEVGLHREPRPTWPAGPVAGQVGAATSSVR